MQTREYASHAATTKDEMQVTKQDTRQIQCRQSDKDTRSSEDLNTQRRQLDRGGKNQGIHTGDAENRWTDTRQGRKHTR